MEGRRKYSLPALTWLQQRASEAPNQLTTLTRLGLSLQHGPALSAAFERRGQITHARTYPGFIEGRKAEQQTLRVRLLQSESMQSHALDTASVYRRLCSLRSHPIAQPGPRIEPGLDWGNFQQALEPLDPSSSKAASLAP